MVGVSTGMKNSRWISLLVLCTGFLLIVVDMTIVNVALPSIQRDLGFSQSGLAQLRPHSSIHEEHGAGAKGVQEAGHG